MDCENTWKFFESTRLTNVFLIAITDSDCPRLPIAEAIMVFMILILQLSITLSKNNTIILGTFSGFGQRISPNDLRR